MATLKQIRDKADAKLAEFWPILQAKQDAYFAKHGKYFQLLTSPEVPVIDGTDTTYSVTLRVDNPYKNDVELVFDSPVPFQIEVHEWVGPVELGYTAYIRVQLLNGDVYERSRDSKGNDTGWDKLTK